jgi:NAD(P)-dependent dehydrogenase (short-subunit alcohol dehydrogenase family)
VIIQSNEHAGRVAVITGGSGGIGGAITDRLEVEGAKVSVLDLKPRTKDGPSSISPQASPTIFHQVDVSKESDVDKTFDAIAEREGAIDYLVCCAAVFPARPFLELSQEDWEKTLDINLTGYFLCCRAALRPMRSRKFGRIVLFSSMLARTGGIHSAHYSASKGGILGLARSIALELAQENIRVNTISPGVTDTVQPRGHLSEEELQAYAARNPLGRIGKVEDMVQACLFLLGDESSYFTGQDIRVNGGSTLW